MTTGGDAIRKRAEQLVTRVGQALLAGNRAAALKMVESILRGHTPISNSDFDKLVTSAAQVTVPQEIWQVAARVFSGGRTYNEKWRSQVGRLIKHCGQERALEVLLDAERTHVGDPQSFIGAAIRNGDNEPFWKMDEQQLMVEAGKLGVHTHGKSRQEIERGIEKARLRNQDQGELGASILGRA